MHLFIVLNQKVISINEIFINQYYFLFSLELSIVIFDKSFNET